jgi:hypothetical protein
MTFKPASGTSESKKDAGSGLRSPDKQQDEHRVQQSNTTNGPPSEPMRSQHDAEGGPEGLRRERTHPINPHTGRGGVPSHVPGGKPKGSALERSGLSHENL